MAEVVGVAGGGYGEVAGLGGAGGGGAGDWAVGGGEAGVEGGGGGGGFLAVEPGELTACVEDHGNLLWG